MTYEFTTKAEYLTAKAQWKVDFKAHITAVRAAKQGIKDANRELSLRGWLEVHRQLYAAYQLLRELHKKTDEMLNTRSKMSQEAQRQYMEQVAVS